MAKKSPLTDRQWDDIERRMSNGEAARLLAREFGVSDTAIRKRASSQFKPLKILAEQLATVELAVESLSLSSQVKVRSNADRLKGILEHGAIAGELGMMTAHRMAQFAHDETAKLDPVDAAGQNANVVRSVVVLTTAANEAAKIGLNLLAANKKSAPPDEENKAPVGLGSFYGEE